MTGEPDELFNAGVNPGDISQEALAGLRQAYDRAIALYDESNPSDDESDRVCDDLVAAYNTCLSSIVLPEAGKYYYITSRVYASAATPDTLYAQGNLLTSTDQIFTSPLANGDGRGISCLLNGRISGSNEYMHTAWQPAQAPNHYHFVGADLRKAVSAITVKFSNRIDGNSRNEYPTQFRVYACNDAVIAADTVQSGSWKWVGDMTARLANDTMDNTWVAFTDLGGDAYRYVRFDVVATGNNSTVAPEGGEAYPFFYISELGVYEATYDADNSPYSSVPEADGEALAAAINAARPEVVAQQAT